MKHGLIGILLFISLCIACGESGKNRQNEIEVIKLEPEVDPKALEVDFMKWWTYHQYNIILSAEFVAFDAQSERIDKNTFLEKLTTGSYIPIGLRSPEATVYYQLFELTPAADESISRTIRSTSVTAYGYFKMEGKHFPNFDLTDLNGTQYTSENIKGRTTIFKTWFIKCQACVAEFPELNELVEKHRDKEDILFISLALDDASDLEDFLKKKAFEYAVIPNQKTFIQEQLQLQMYPTHLVVGEDGVILKVVDKASELMDFLEDAAI